MPWDPLAHAPSSSSYPTRAVPVWCNSFQFLMKYQLSCQGISETVYPKNPHPACNNPSRMVPAQSSLVPLGQFLFQLQQSYQTGNHTSSSNLTRVAPVWHVPEPHGLCLLQIQLPWQSSHEVVHSRTPPASKPSGSCNLHRRCSYPGLAFKTENSSFA